MSLLSFTGVAGYFMFTSYGISLTSGLHVSIIDAALPLVTILFQRLLKEKFSLIIGSVLYWELLEYFLLLSHLVTVIKKYL